MNKNNNKKVIVKIIVLSLYIILNFILVLYHEQWRDEAHGWLMPKYLTIKELFIESKYDGHPILWYLIIMPFAKLGFPFITNQIINLILMSIAAYLFLFKTKLNDIFKIIVLFTIPFMYVYTAIARNYGLILLMLIIIAIFYEKRYEKPILYSALIALLVHTHSLAWGLVAGLTITFHFYELTINFKKHSKQEIIDIVFGLIIIVFSTILVVYELYGKRSGGYQVFANNIVNVLTMIMAIVLIITFVLNGKINKEWIILLSGYGFTIIIYYFIYSAILLQRYMLVFVYFLFYILIVCNNNCLKKEKLNRLFIYYLIIIFAFGMKYTINEIYNDIKYPYSSAKEMAEYINENLKNEDIVLVDSSLITQSIGAYLDNNNLYDFCEQRYVGCADSTAYAPFLILVNINCLSEFKGKYVIISNDLLQLNFKEIYKTKKSIQNEFFTLYYIE